MKPVEKEGEETAGEARGGGGGGGGGRQVRTHEPPLWPLRRSASSFLQV